jgi:3-isopropylmalate/(R)-2-methylmalate dehydratase small subunit
MITGRVWKFGNDISTDLILPGAVVHQPMAVQLRQVFSANRPGWIDVVQAGDVLVGGDNFGMGSARPAPRVLRDLKLSFLLSEKINNLFLRSCVNFGFLALDCPGVCAAFQEGDVAELSIERWSVRNVSTGVMLKPLPVPSQFLAMMQSGGIFPMLEAEGLIAPQKLSG